MPEPFVGEIRMFAGNFPPAGWLFCDGTPLAISENEILFQLIGTTYGGDGESSFALPDLRGRLPMHMGTGAEGTTYTIGESGGVESVTLTTQQIPIHTHTLLASTGAGSSPTPVGNVLASNNVVSMYKAAAATTPMNAQAAGPAGGSQPHTNFQPYLCLNFIISLFGVYPSPS